MKLYCITLIIHQLQHIILIKYFNKDYVKLNNSFCYFQYVAFSIAPAKNLRSNILGEFS